VHGASHAYHQKSHRQYAIDCASSPASLQIEVAQSITYKKPDTTFILFDYLNLKAK
jgi:hypothetical protein